MTMLQYDLKCGEYVYQSASTLTEEELHDLENGFNLMKFIWESGKFAAWHTPPSSSRTFVMENWPIINRAIEDLYDCMINEYGRIEDSKSKQDDQAA
jgi:hypothetical protein